MQTDSTDERIETVDGLRGIAAIAVAWFHITNGAKWFLDGGVLEYSGRYGWLGVQVFFVISGFIIPYSLHRSHYSMSQFGRFMLRRVVRLDPPYLVTVVLIIALDYGSSLVPGFKGTAFSFS